MELLILLVVVVGGIAAVSTLSRRNQAKQLQRKRDAELEQVRKVADEDTTRFGEELQQLDLETLTATLDTAARQDYQRALDSYESAKDLLRDARVPDDVQQATKTLEDGRYAMACVLARVAGEPLHQRRPPCFFNPAHGPAQTDVVWAPAGGNEREIPVCLADADRIAHGAEPDTRQVRKGNRMVPWYQGGPAYGPYAGGYYGAYALNGLFPAFILGSMMGGMGGWGDGSYAEGFADGQSDPGDDWSQEGGGGDGGDWGGGGDGGGGDSGGDWGGGGDVGGGGDWGGGFDGGGFDFGGFDF
jgi:hypothetical protein